MTQKDIPLTQRWPDLPSDKLRLMLQLYHSTSNFALPVLGHVMRALSMGQFFSGPGRDLWGVVPVQASKVGSFMLCWLSSTCDRFSRTGFRLCQKQCLLPICCSKATCHTVHDPVTCHAVCCTAGVCKRVSLEPLCWVSYSPTTWASGLLSTQCTPPAAQTTLLTVISTVSCIYYTKRTRKRCQGTSLCRNTQEHAAGRRPAYAASCFMTNTGLANKWLTLTKLANT